MKFKHPSFFNSLVAGLLASGLVVAAFAPSAVAGPADPSVTVTLWPSGAPGEVEGEIGPEEMPPPNPKAARQVKRLTNVSEPRFEVYPAPETNNTGCAVVVCPGGGYSILAFEHEGTQVMEWLNSIGVTGILLKYRVPRREGREKHEAPLQDVQRTLGLVRENAERWGIDPDRIGLLGFSAGGHLTLTTGTHFEKRTYEKIDAADERSCRPDFLIPVYPAYLVDKNNPTGELPSEIRVTEQTPPAFFAHAHDDPHSPEGSALVYIALKRAGVPAELHVYTKGGHGFGMIDAGDPVSTWPQRCAEWMDSMGFLGE